MKAHRLLLSENLRLEERTLIKDIVFDVGRVLINFSYDDLFLYFKENNIHITSVQGFVEKTHLKIYESGHISNEAYLDNLTDLFNMPVNRDELKQKWVEIFEPITEMLEWAVSLKRDYGVFLISNTSPLHWDYLKTEYHLDQVASGLLTSFEVGVLKPDAAIFKAAEQRFHLNPLQTLFIDDLEDNVKGAISCGWQGIHHQSTEETQQRVRHLLEKS